MTPPVFHVNFGGVLVGPDRLRLSALKLFSKYSACVKNIPESHRQRRRNRRTTSFLWYNCAHAYRIER